MWPRSDMRFLDDLRMLYYESRERLTWPMYVYILGQAQIELFMTFFIP